MKLLFLFGAGASTFSGPCYPARPPLGNELFGELRHKGGAFNEFDLLTITEFQKSFEDGMEHIFKNNSAMGTTLLKEMAIYLSEFDVLPDNLYLKFAELLKRWNHDVVLSTLNYDLLIESALRSSGIVVDHVEAKALAARNKAQGFDRRAILLKLHGSCNFLPGRNSGIATGFSVNSRIPCSGLIESGVHCATREEVLHHCLGEDVRPPAMCYYARGKDPSQTGNFVHKQYFMWKDCLKKATDVFIIGVRLNEHDTHLWEPLSSAGGNIHYVDPKPKEFEQFIEKKGLKNWHHFADTFENCLIKMDHPHGPPHRAWCDT